MKRPLAFIERLRVKLTPKGVKCRNCSLSKTIAGVEKRCRECERIKKLRNKQRELIS